MHAVVGRTFTGTSGRRRAAALFGLWAFSALVSPASAGAQAGRGPEHWVDTWATAVVARPPAPAAPAAPAAAPAAPAAPAAQAAPAPRPPLNFTGQTLRQIVHTSVGGDRVRVVFSNTFGTTPLVIGRAQVALRDKGSAIVAKSAHPLTFGGNPGMTIPAGAIALSDAAALAVPALSDLAIDAFLPGDSNGTTVTMHTGAFQTNFVSNPGDHVGAAEFPVATDTQSWFYLARVEVTAPQPTGTIVVLGDSISDGTRSTPDTNNRWPDHLAKRLMAQPGTRMGIANLGIAGNRVLSDGAGVSALARFDRDVVAQPNAAYVVFMEGINDVGLVRGGPRPKVEDLIAGHRQVIERAHARGLKIYAATLTPFEGVTIPNYWSEEGETTRQALNEWIRTGKAYDGVIDFDKLIRDPNNPRRIAPQFSSVDNLHPNDAGYQAMGNAVDLALFKAASGKGSR